MEQYIPKSVVLTEIERKKEEEVNYDEDSKSFASYADHVYYLALDSMQDFINTIEVKELKLDLNKEIKKYSMELAMKENNGDWLKDITATAKHFFELGLKAQKGENI